jgi:hypothetical protein
MHCNQIRDDPEKNGFHTEGTEGTEEKQRMGPSSVSSVPSV